MASIQSVQLDHGTVPSTRAPIIISPTRPRERRAPERGTEPLTQPPRASRGIVALSDPSPTSYRSFKRLVVTTKIMSTRLLWHVIVFRGETEFRGEKTQSNSKVKCRTVSHLQEKMLLLFSSLEVTAEGILGVARWHISKVRSRNSMILDVFMRGNQRRFAPKASTMMLSDKEAASCLDTATRWENLNQAKRSTSRLSQKMFSDLCRAPDPKRVASRHTSCPLLCSSMRSLPTSKKPCASRGTISLQKPLLPASSAP